MKTASHTFPPPAKRFWLTLLLCAVFTMALGAAGCDCGKTILLPGQELQNPQDSGLQDAPLEPTQQPDTAPSDTPFTPDSPTPEETTPETSGQDLPSGPCQDTDTLCSVCDTTLSKDETLLFVHRKHGLIQKADQFELLDLSNCQRKPLSVPAGMTSTGVLRSPTTARVLLALSGTSTPTQHRVLILNTDKGELESSLDLPDTTNASPFYPQRGFLERGVISPFSRHSIPTTFRFALDHNTLSLLPIPPDHQRIASHFFEHLEAHVFINRNAPAEERYLIQLWSTPQNKLIRSYRTDRFASYASLYATDHHLYHLATYSDSSVNRIITYPTAPNSLISQENTPHCRSMLTSPQSNLLICLSQQATSSTLLRFQLSPLKALSPMPFDKDLQLIALHKQHLYAYNPKTTPPSVQKIDIQNPQTPITTLPSPASLLRAISAEYTSMTYTKTPLSYRLFLSQINDQNRFITLDLESSKLQLLPETFPIPPEMGRITYGWRLYKDTFAHFTEGSTRDQSPKTAFLQVANGRTITKFDAFLSSPADNTHRNSRLEAGFFRKPDTNEQVSWYAVDLHHNKAATYNLPDLTQAGLSWSNLYLVLSTKPRNQDDTNLQIYRPIPQ